MRAKPSGGRGIPLVGWQLSEDQDMWRLVGFDAQ